MSWIQTYSGALFDPLEPMRHDISLQDVAHSLSMQCRYNGHCLKFYSVAEHCVILVAALRRDGVKDQDALRWALLHDAPESWLCDLPRPLKPHMLGYADLEEAAERAVAERFNLSPTIPDIVKEYDARVLHDEKAQNMAPGPAWDIPGKPLGVKLKFWEPEEAKYHFLAVARMLGLRVA